MCNHIHLKYPTCVRWFFYCFYTLPAEVFLGKATVPFLGKRGVSRYQHNKTITFTFLNL